jgi:long-chain acyl-CoA synthetase
MLVEPLLAHAAKTPHEIAVRDDEGSHTYQQLADWAAGLGKYLSAQTRQPNVGLLLPAGAGFVASFYGILLAGKCVVPINFLLGEREIQHVLADSGLDTVVTIGPLAGKLHGAQIKIVDLGQLPKAPPGVGPAAAPARPTRSANDAAVLMYTSGTSGMPKGVILTYGNLQSDVDACIEHARLQNKHKFLGVIPLFHAFGMTAMMLAPIQLAAQVVYLARFSPVGTLNAIREHEVSLVFAVPSMFGAIANLKNAAPADFKSIYALISGGEPLPATVRDGFEKRFNVPIYEGYGLTETSPVISLNTPHDHRPGSVGRTVPGVIVKIADDNGQPLPLGATGEVWLKGPMIMKGYHNLPNDTAAVMTTDGFFKTGDLGKLDDDGYLFITGRKKDLIIVAGEKASPREIEEMLMRHPAVAEAAVVGKKDASRGEVVVAFIIAKQGQTLKPEDLRDFGRAQGLAQWKIPREIFVQDELPRSPTGKVLKRVLAEQVNRVRD